MVFFFVFHLYFCADLAAEAASLTLRPMRQRQHRRRRLRCMRDIWLYRLCEWFVCKRATDPIQTKRKVLKGLLFSLFFVVVVVVVASNGIFLIAHSFTSNRTFYTLPIDLSFSLYDKTLDHLSHMRGAHIIIIISGVGIVCRPFLSSFLCLGLCASSVSTEHLLLLTAVLWLPLLWLPSPPSPPLRANFPMYPYKIQSTPDTHVGLGNSLGVKVR